MTRRQETYEPVLKRLHFNSFAKNRHVPGEAVSHFGGTEKELARKIAAGFKNWKPGYRAGVILVPVDPKGFFTPVATLHPGEQALVEFKSRRPGESPRLGLPVVRRRRKPAAKAVDIVLYASNVLAEGGDNELPPAEGNWEIISINARPTKSAEPIAPTALIANHFGWSGGTKTEMNDKQFVQALRKSTAYWRNKAMVKPL